MLVIEPTLTMVVAEETDYIIGSSEPLEEKLQRHSGPKATQGYISGNGNCGFRMLKAR
jgi:hypothetical protein